MITLRELVDDADINEIDACELHAMGCEALKKMLEAIAVIKLIRDGINNEDESSEASLKRFNADMQILQAEYILDNTFSPSRRKMLKEYLAHENKRAEAKCLKTLPLERIHEFAQETIDEFLDEYGITVHPPGCDCRTEEA